MKTMTLSDGVARIELPTDDETCSGCDLLMSDVLCKEARHGKSTQAFGSDCADREVIYIKADPQPAKD